MANAITDLQMDVLAQGALDAMLPILTPLNAFSRNFSSEGARKGKVVEVRQYNKVTSAGQFNISTANYETATDIDWDEVQVTLNRHEKHTFKLNEAEQAVMLAGDVPKELEITAEAVAEGVLTDIWSVITNANYGAAAFVGAASTFDSDDIMDIRNTCIGNNMNKRELKLIIDNDYYTSLLKDNDLKNALNSQTDAVLKEAMVPRVGSFDVYESTIIPANAENLVGFATDGNGIAIANAVLQPGIGYEGVVAWATATDPVTGLTIGTRAHLDPATGETFFTVECLYGYSVGNTAALERMTSV